MASRPVRWQELMKEGEGYNGPYRPGYSAGNVPAQEPMSVPVSEAAGKITPSGDTSGLYAIYGRKNPCSSEVDRYSRMSGRDMGGRLGQLPGIAATFMAGRAASKSQAFEETRQKQIDDFMARKEEHDKIQNDWEAKKRGVEIFQKEVIPMMEQAWDQKYSETKDPEIAGKYAASVGNDESTKSKLGTPLLLNYGKWQDGTRTTIWRGSTGEISQGVVNAKGELGVLIKKGDKVVTVPADDKDMIFGDYVKLQDVKNRQKSTEQKGVYAGSRDPVVQVLGQQLNSYRKMRADGQELSPEMEEQERAIMDEFFKRTQVKPGYIPKSTEDKRGFFVKAWDSMFGSGEPTPKSVPVAPTQQPTVQPQAAPASAPQQDPRRAKAEEILRANKLVVNEDTLAKIMRQLP